MTKRTEAYYHLIDNNLPSIWQISYYWQNVIKECNNLICHVDILKWAVTARLSTNLCFFLYCQYIDGKIICLELGNGKHLNYGLCSRQFLDLFKDKEEIQIVRGEKGELID